MEMEFDMIGIDAALANAFRRILLAEVILNIKIIR
jgi:DNA-directed RNA polymerase alpha subunit